MTTGAHETAIAMVVLLALFLFNVKHLIIDFFLQTPYQWKNKGTMGHPGGLLHSGLHALGTMIVVYLLVDTADNFLFLCAIVDFFAHYAIDYVKMNVNRIKNWHPQTEQFYLSIGVDQFCHQLTYIGLTLMLFWL